LRYDVFDLMGRRVRTNIDLATVAELLNLHPEDIEWAIEEFGRCDGEEYVVVENGDPFPGTA
jgi:hypothetical protein